MPKGKGYKNVRDSYKTYRDNTEPAVDVNVYCRIVNLYHKFLINKVLEGEDIALPHRLGALHVAGRKEKIRFVDGQVKGLAPDWVKTKELWETNPEAKEEKKLIYHTNSHSNNIRYKFVWTKRDVLVRNKTLFALRLTRTNKRELHKRIIAGQEYFIKYRLKKQMT